MADHYLYVIHAADHLDVLCEAVDCGYRTEVARSARVDELVAMQEVHRRAEWARALDGMGSAAAHRNGCMGCDHSPAEYPPCWTGEQADQHQRAMHGLMGRG